MQESFKAARLITSIQPEIPRLLDAYSTKVIEYPKGKSWLSQISRRDEKYLRDIVECALISAMRK